MGVLASDDFNRANSTGLGANWTGVPNNTSHNVSSNQALSAADPTADFYNGAVWPNDQYSQAVMVNAGNASLTEDNGPGLCVRASNAANTMYFTMHNNHGIDLYSVVADSYANIGNYDSAQANNDVGYLEAQGTTIIAKQNGTTRITVTDSSISAGRAGIFGAEETINPLIDDWVGGDFAGAAAGQPTRRRFGGVKHMTRNLGADGVGVY